MTDSTVGRVPAMKAVWTEQLRVVGLAIRREGALAAVVLALGSLALVAFSRMPVLQAIVDEGEVGELVFDPGEPPWGFFAVLAALLLPLVVWKGERRFGDTPLWSLPVDHRRHALLKVAAGWVWLLAILGAALVWVTLTVLASGGALGVDEVRLLIIDPVGATAGTPGATESVRWTTPWWGVGTPVHVGDRHLPAGQHPDARHGASAVLGRRAVGRGRGRAGRHRGPGHRLDSADRRARCLVRRWRFVQPRGASPDRWERGVDAAADHGNVDGIVRVLDQPGAGGGAGGVLPAAESLIQELWRIMSMT